MRRYVGRTRICDRYGCSSFRPIRFFYVDRNWAKWEPGRLYVIPVIKTRVKQLKNRNVTPLLAGRYSPICQAGRDNPPGVFSGRKAGRFSKTKNTNRIDSFFRTYEGCWNTSDLSPSDVSPDPENSTVISTQKRFQRRTHLHFSKICQPWASRLDWIWGGHQVDFGFIS